MKQYYLKDGTRERGPYLIDDLKYQRIRPETLVKVDNGKWQPISHVDDLLFLLKDNDGQNTYSSVTSSQPTTSTAQRQPLSNPQTANKRLVVLIAISVALATMGMAAAFFFATASN